MARTKKTENVESVTEAAAVEEQAAPEKKNTTKKTAEKKTTKTASEKKATKAVTEKKTTKAESEKKTTKKAAEDKKAKTEAGEKKETKRKTTTKKVVKKVVLEFHNSQTPLDVEAYEEKVKDIWLNDWNRLAKDLKSIDLYIKPEDHKVYFVINGEEHGRIDL